MNRREFCKIAALAAGAFGVGGARAAASTLGLAGASVRGRVTVLRCECFAEIQSMYLDDPESGPCPVFKAGESWNLADGLPEGFCPRAREAIERSAAMLASCPDASAEDEAIIVACPDGSRPVIFRIER